MNAGTDERGNAKQAVKRYQIAIYMRLSKEDGGGTESNSITVQRVLLRKYADEHFADYDLSEFTDDGYSGTNFNRPGMQEMLGMVRESKIDCIIVKDFSRFARDYIELGAYLEQIFPFMGVRFISVNDGYDSGDGQDSPVDIDVNFKNLLYDLYSKDLSKKVRSSLAARKEKGEYVSANSPFGYEKNPDDRHGLVIAEDEAAVVRKIFSLALEGYTGGEITRLLNETGVKTPVEFKIEKGKTSCVPKGGRFSWNSSTVCSILRNEVYIGNIVQKKYSRDFAGGKNHLNPREDWLVSCRHHEPLIEKEVFDKVQEGRGRRRPPARSPAHPLTGKLVCGCCGKNLAYRRGHRPYFECRSRYANAKSGCVRRADAGILEQRILLMLQKNTAAGREGAAFYEEICKETAGRLDVERKELGARRERLLSQASKLQNLKFEEYLDYALGKTKIFQPDDKRLESVEKELESLNERIRKLETEYACPVCEGDWPDTGDSPGVLTGKTVDRLIEKVVVYDEVHLEISLHLLNRSGH